MPARRKAKDTEDLGPRQVSPPGSPPEGEPDARPAEPAMVEKPEPTASEWAARRERLLATVPPVEKRPATLYGKLAQILGLIPTVEKRGVNDFHKYSYAKESDLVEAVRPLLSEYGIFFWWSVVDHERRVQTKTKGDQAGIEAETLSVIMVQFKFIDADGNTTEPQTVPAYGDDPIDKGIYKALTGAVKYALMKTFLIATGDDPEADKAADRRGASYEARGRVEVQRGRPGASQSAPGGRQRASSAPQEVRLSSLLKEAGAHDSTEAAVLIGELMGQEVTLGEDKAASLVAFLNGLAGEVKGKLIYDLRKRIEAKAAGTSTAATADVAAPEGDGPSGGEGGTRTTGPDESSLEAGSAL